LLVREGHRADAAVCGIGPSYAVQIEAKVR